MADKRPCNTRPGMVDLSKCPYPCEDDTKPTETDPALASMLLFGDIFQDLPKLSDEHLRLLGIQIIVLLKTPPEERHEPS